eukprot:764708-Hanusia_phi.AAC.2
MASSSRSKDRFMLVSRACAAIMLGKEREEGRREEEGEGRRGRRGGKEEWGVGDLRVIDLLLRSLLTSPGQRLRRILGHLIFRLEHLRAVRRRQGEGDGDPEVTLVRHASCCLQLSDHLVQLVSSLLLPSVNSLLPLPLHLKTFHHPLERGRMLFEQPMSMHYAPAQESLGRRSDGRMGAGWSRFTCRSSRDKGRCEKSTILGEGEEAEAEEQETSRGRRGIGSLRWRRHASSPPPSARPSGSPPACAVATC